MSTNYKETIINTRVPEELKNKFRLLCQAEGVTMSEHLRMYVEAHCEKYTVDLKIADKKKN